MIPLAQCKDRTLYRLEARNLLYGVFNAKAKIFIGIREKFGDEYLDAEDHHETGAPFGTAKPLVELTELPVEVVNAQSLGTFCLRCNSGCSWDSTNGWLHTEPTECNECRPCGRHNQLLFDWIKDNTK